MFNIEKKCSNNNLVSLYTILYKKKKNCHHQRSLEFYAFIGNFSVHDSAQYEKRYNAQFAK